MTVTVRPETAGDEPAIHALTDAAFHGVPHSDGSEAEIVDRLRAAGALALSLVAENADLAIVGHVAFSRVTISDGSTDWYGLGPVSVIPTVQRTGIGVQLIEAGIEVLRRGGACGIVLLGDPAYYRRFGFANDPVLRYPGPPTHYFQRLILSGDAPCGTVRYAPAFG